MNNKEVLSLNKITKTRLKELCKKHKLYQTPHLNDQLYLHYQGFQAIENLDEYTGLKCLWLESNAISEIEGLDCQPELKCLFLQNNLIKKIENLHSCLVLDTLNLASNHITRVENCGVDVLPVLSTLNLSRNYLRNSEGLRELVNCRNLCSLDLSHNRIDDILVVKIFANMPELRVLVLQGNPVVSQVPQYRKTLILECKNLTYLDSRPVFPKDRACAEAWKRGGYEEERRENERWVREDRKKIRDSVNATLRLRQKQGGGDVQLLESTDDEEESSKPKKLRQIPEEVINADLEITGVDPAGKNEYGKADMELKASESSLSVISGSESALNSADGLDEEPNESVIDIQMHPNRDETSIEATCSNIQSQYLEEQVEQILETNEEKNLVTSGDKIDMPKATELHDKEANIKIEPMAFEAATPSVGNENTTQSIYDNKEGPTKPFLQNSVEMTSATSFSQQVTVWNESSALHTTWPSDPSLASDSSSNGSSISNNADTISDNADSTSEYMPREDCSENSNLKQEYNQKEAAKYEEAKNRVTDVAVLTQKFSFNISSESQFGDSELRFPSITEEEESLQNLDETFEIGTQGKIHLRHSTFSEQVSPSPTWESDRNLSDIEDSNGDNMHTISEVEDSGCFNIFNSVEASEKTLTSDDESDGLPPLECVLSNQQDDSENSARQDVILKKLIKTEANRANEDNNQTTDSLPQSEMMTPSKANTLSSSLFVENSDEEMTLHELDASTWLHQNLATSVETNSQEPFMETIDEEGVLSEKKAEDSASTKADGEKSSSEESYQSDGSSLLEYILKISKEAEYDKSSPEIYTVDIGDEKPFAGDYEDETLYEEMKSPSEELGPWVEKVEKDEDSASDENISLQNMLATITRKREDNSITEDLDGDQLSQWLEKDQERALEEKLSLQHLLSTLEEEKEEKLPSDEFSRRRMQLEQWLGKNEGKFGDSDEDENLGEKQEYIYTQSIEDDEESLSSMYNTELVLSEDTAFEEDDMLQSILKKIEEEEHFALESVDEKSENIQERLDEAKEKSPGGLSDGLGSRSAFSCSSPYEEVFDNKHFSLISETRLEGCNISQEDYELTQDEFSEDSSEDSVLTRLPLDDRTVTLESGSAMNVDIVPSNDSWWERTLAAARESTEPPKVPTHDESFEETINQTQSLENIAEASALLEQILTKTHEKKVEIHTNHTEPPEPPSIDVIEESKPPTTLRDVLSSFNKIAETITTTRYLTTYALTRDFSTQSNDQISRQVEEMNREQRERVSQMIDRVYAQKDKYVDNLEVVDGRLMVVKRTTGALEELPLPPTSSSKYASCGVSTTRANCNDSDSDDDYGTALSEDEPDDDDDGDIEQHASDTKIKKIPYLSSVYGNESTTSTGMVVEDNCHWESNEQTMDSNHKVMGLCDESDAVAGTDGMEKPAPSPAGWVTTEKGNGED